MAEPVDPPRHRPRPDAIPPLPRLWKATPEPVEEASAPGKAGKGKKREGDAVDAKKKGKSKQNPIDDADDDGTGATKLAETPVLDTYEARQRARWIIGGVLGSIGLITLLLIVRAFRGGEAEPKEAAEGRVDLVAAEVRAKSEQEAHNLIEVARQADKAGKIQAALDTLGKVAKNYQGTPSARLAMEAIDRNRRKRSLFGSDEDPPTGPKAPSPVAGAATSPPAATPPSPTGPLPGLPTATAPTPPPEATGPTAPKADGSTGPEGTIRPRPLPIGFFARPTTPLHASGWPTEIVCDRDGAEMAFIPAATFIMGREDGDPEERPTHRVTVSAYYIDRHEVTTRQFLQFLKDTGRPLDPTRFSPKDPELPATGMTAREAKAYCEWARRRLPTEAQWELAARSTDGRISYWNGEIPRKDTPKGTRAIEPVMTLSTDVSPFGVFDLGANAWELTSEWYDSQYYQQVKNGVTDPTGPAASRAKPAEVTVKGGSKLGILTWRDGIRLEARFPYLGFRGALPVEGVLIAPPPAQVVPVGPNALPGGVPPL